MPKNPPSFQFYPQDFLGGTGHLDHVAIATYLLLLCYQWIQKKLPSEHVQLARLCRLPEQEFAQNWSKIQDKFMLDDEGRPYNERLQLIMDKAFELSERRAKYGQKGGLAKALAKGVAKGVAKRSSSVFSLQSSLNNPIVPLSKDEQFELFWSFARIKAGKARARKHYDRAIASLKGHADPHGYLLDRWKLYQQSDRGQSEYAWEPCAWLRDGHFGDDPSAWEKRSSKTSDNHDDSEPCLAGPMLDRRDAERKLRDAKTANSN